MQNVIRCELETRLPNCRRKENAHLWCLGIDDAIKADNNVAFVGPYNPVTFNFGGYRKGVKPADIEGFDTPILGKK